MDPGTRMLLANLWLLEGPVAREFAERSGLEPAVRTTVVPSRVWIGDEVDRSSTRAFAELAVGIAPWDTPDSVLGHVWGKVDGLGVEIAFSEPGPVPPSRVSSSASVGFGQVRRAVLRTFPDVVEAAPGLVETPTPGRRYEEVAEDVYRFVPLRAEPDLVASVGGPNERIRLANYLEMIRFYAALIREGAS
jgi:carboxypeptidase PM20D1